MCGLPFLPMFLDVAQYDADKRPIGLREGEAYLTIRTEGDAWRAGHGLAKIVHGLAMAQMKFKMGAHDGLGMPSHQ